MPIPRLTPLTIPNNSSIGSCIFAQLCNKAPIGYNGMPHIYPQNCPFPLQLCPPHLIHPSLNQPHSSPKMASRSNQPFCHNSPSGQTDSDRQLTSPRKLSLPFEDNHPHVIHPSLNRPHSPPQMASRCNQPFCHNTLCRLTDRLTDRQLTLALFYEDQPERMDSTSALWQLCCECYWMHTCRHNFLGSLPCERSKCEN